MEKLNQIKSSCVKIVELVQFDKTSHTYQRTELLFVWSTSYTERSDLYK